MATLKKITSGLADLPGKIVEQWPLELDTEKAGSIAEDVIPVIANPVSSAVKALSSTGIKAAKAYADLPQLSNQALEKSVKGAMDRSGLVPKVKIPEVLPITNQDKAIDRIAAKAGSSQLLPAPSTPTMTNTARPAVIPPASDSLSRLMAANPNLRVNVNGQSISGPAAPGTQVISGTKTVAPSDNSSIIRIVLPDGTISIRSKEPSFTGPSVQPSFYDSVQEKLIGAMKELSRAQILNGPNPTPEGSKRVKDAMEAVQILGALTKNIAPSFQTLGPGQVGFHVSPEGKATRIADNIEPYEARLKEAAKIASSKQETANKKSMFSEASKKVSSAWKVFSKGWDDITKAYEGDPEGLATALNKHQASYFQGLGVPNDPLNGVDGPGLADIPQSFNLFVKQVVGGRPANAEQLNALKKKHTDLLRQRKAFIDDFYQKIGYHTDNAKYGSSETSTDNEE